MKGRRRQLALAESSSTNYDTKFAFGVLSCEVGGAYFATH